MDEENREKENENNLELELVVVQPKNTLQPDAVISPNAAISSDDKAATIAPQAAQPVEKTFKPMETAGTEAVEELLAMMNKLLVEFQGKLKYDAKKQEQIDRLYDENCALKSGLMEAFKKQLILGLIEKIDIAEKNISGFRPLPYTEENYRRLISTAEELPSLFQDLLLDSFNVHCRQSNEGTAFEPSRQHILRTAPTSDESLNKTLVRSIRRGYQTEEGKIIRPELVEVYLYRNPKPTEK